MRTKRYRSFQNGRVWSISGGAANQPLVCLVADVLWGANSDTLGAWESWTLPPQVLSFRRAWFASQGHRALLDWLGTDLGPEPGLHLRHGAPAPQIVLLDDSQSPAAGELLAQLQQERPTLQTLPVRLTPGDHDPLNGHPSYTDNGATRVGARWLGSWFNATAARDKPDQQRYGAAYAPGQTVVSFADFQEEGPPGMTRDEVRAGMSAATRLVRPQGGRSDGDTLDLSADEVVAATAMLALLAAELQQPLSEYDPDSWNGYTDTLSYRTPNLV
jgi:hypothetical protein